MFIYSNGYWEVYRRFQGGNFGLGGGISWGFTWVYMEEFVMEEENFNEWGAGFSSIILKKIMNKQI